MTFLPIVERELRVRARQPQTYRLRWSAAIGAFLLLMALLGLADLTSQGGEGTVAFGVLAGLAFLFCLIEGVRNTADCLSEEKRAGTLGLLFLTDLRGYDVVLGKLIATSLHSFYALLAVFPPLALPLVLGGVTAGEFWRITLALFCTLALSLACGLFVSAISRSERKAWLGTVGVTALLAAGPIVAFIFAFDASFRSAPAAYWIALVPVPVIGVGLVAAASVVLPRAWQDKSIPPAAPSSARLSSKQKLSGPQPRSRSAELESLLSGNPVAWLTARHEGLQTSVWSLVAVACALAAVFWIATWKTPLAMPVLVVPALALHLALVALVATHACDSVWQARHSGLLGLLLVTPLSVQEIVEGHFQGLLRLFRKPIATLLGFVFLLALLQALSPALDGELKPDHLAFACVAALILLGMVFDYYAVGRYGLWMGLVSAKPIRGIIKTVLYVVVLPLALTSCCFLVWPIVVLAKNGIFITHAQEMLRQRLRPLVTEAMPSSPATRRPILRRKRPVQLPRVLEK